jgi:hypothetical protein
MQAYTGIHSHSPRFRRSCVLETNVSNVHTLVFATEAALAVVSVGWVTSVGAADLVNLFHLLKPTAPTSKKLQGKNTASGYTPLQKPKQSCCIYILRKTLPRH